MESDIITRYEYGVPMLWSKMIGASKKLIMSEAIKDTPVVVQLALLT